MNAPQEPVDVSDVQGYCPDCGGAVWVEVTIWPDGERTTQCPDACDEGHRLTGARRTLLIAGALAALERAQEREARDADEPPR
jgi:hypothetical protein